jgi:hypothetical protein
MELANSLWSLIIFLHERHRRFPETEVYKPNVGCLSEKMDTENGIRTNKSN